MGSNANVKSPGALHLENFNMQKIQEDSLKAAQSLGSQDTDLKSSIGEGKFYPDEVISTIFGGMVEPTPEIQTIPGLVSGGLLDLFTKGIVQVGEAEQKHAEYMGQNIQWLGEDLPGKMLAGDYKRAILATTAGAPVDIANSLLSLLGIEVSNKPFLGSRQIKESLDYISGQPHSTKYIR